jgi:hypothetical protein
LFNHIISLEAVQTPDSRTPEIRDSNPVDWYLQVLGSIKEQLQRASRHVAKLSFNFNASLTTVNLAKVLARERGIPFSVLFRLYFCNVENE